MKEGLFKGFFLKIKEKLSGYQIAVILYVSVILLGSALLSIPAASKSGAAPSYLDCLFTSASATCVTGLTVADTFLQWSLFGQIIILTLVQAGGLGFMTVMTFILLLLKGRLSLSETSLFLQSAGGGVLSSGKKLVKNIILWTFACELLGTALLCIRFCQDFGAEGIWISLFTAVSAICNAGFDLMGRFGENSSLIVYSSDALVLLTVIFLMFLGSVGFLALSDAAANKGKWKKYSLQTKIIFSLSFALIILGAVSFMALEWNGVLEGKSFGEKLLCSLFSSVSPRTAGYFVVKTSSLSDAARFLTVALMFIGGSPGGTAGGIKTTTFLVLFLSVFSQMKRRSSITVCKRRIDGEALPQAAAVASLYLTLITLCTVIILAVEKLPLSDALFEVVSAIGTVGLTTGITQSLSALSKIILMFLMLAGRVGVLSVALVFSRKKGIAPLDRPTEKITVG